MSKADPIEEFAAALPSNGRLLGIDLGTKTIGIAISDLGRRVATPMVTLPRGKFAKDLAALQDLIAKESAVGIVIGDPLNMDGSVGPRAQSARAFARNVAAQIEIPVVMWDERLSTTAVTRTLIEADRSRARRAQLVDKMAASYILQGALDRMAGRA